MAVYPFGFPNLKKCPECGSPFSTLGGAGEKAPEEEAKHPDKGICNVCGARLL